MCSPTKVCDKHSVAMQPKHLWFSALQNLRKTREPLTHGVHFDLTYVYLDSYTFSPSNLGPPAQHPYLRTTLSLLFIFIIESLMGFYLNNYENVNKDQFIAIV